MAEDKEKENLFQSMSRFIESGIDPVSRHEEIWERYGETVAVLVLDSSGFSRVTESHGIIQSWSTDCGVIVQIRSSRETPILTAVGFSR